MADFQALLAEQKRTSDILSKQRNPLDARTGAGRALLDQQKQTNEKLDRIAELNDKSLLEDNLSNIAEIINARLLQSKDEKFQDKQGITQTDNLLSNQRNKGEGLYDIQKKYNDASLPLLEKMANSMVEKPKDDGGDGGGEGDGDEKDPKKLGRIAKIFAPIKSIFGKMKGGIGKFFSPVTKIFGKIFTPIKAIFGGVKSAFGKVVGGVVGLKKFIPEGIRNALSGLFNKFFGGFKFLLTTAATVLALGFLIKFLRSPEWKEMQKTLIPKLAAGFRFLGEDLVPLLVEQFKLLLKALVEFKEDLIDILDFIPGVNIRTKEERKARERIESLQEMKPEDVVKRKAEIDTEIKNVQIKLKDLEGKTSKISRRDRDRLSGELLRLQDEKADLQFFDEKGNLLSSAKDTILIPFLKEGIEESQAIIAKEKRESGRNVGKNTISREESNIERLQRQLKEAQESLQELILKQSDAKGNSGNNFSAQANTINHKQDSTYFALGKPTWDSSALSHMSTSQYT